jgi:hypothetical protein
MISWPPVNIFYGSLHSGYCEQKNFMNHPAAPISGIVASLGQAAGVSSEKL